jgi:hypothetical protein
MQQLGIFLMQETQNLTAIHSEAVARIQGAEIS